MEELRLGFIGGGMMAEALISGMIEGKVIAPNKITVYDPFPARLETLEKEYGVKTAEHNTEVREFYETRSLQIPM